MNPPKPDSPVLWLQVFGLAGMQGAITLSWVIYGLYLPVLLKQVGLPVSLVVPLLVVENALAILMEPLMGGLSDRAQRQLGTRLPFILAGVILAATLLIALPAIAIFGATAARSLLLFALVTWALAMTIFRSPMMVLLANYAFETKLPQAFSILTLVGGFAGALRPLAGAAILNAGPPVAFAVGSGVLLLAALVLRSVHVPGKIPSPTDRPSLPQQSLLALLLLLFCLGMTVAWAVRWLMGEIFPAVLQAQLPGISLNLLMGILSLCLAVFALPAGVLAARLGNSRLMILGLLGTVIMVMTLGNVQGGWSLGVAIALTLCFSPVVNGTIPLALALVPPQRVGLAIGVYFGGFSAAISLFGAVFGAAASMPLVYREMWAVTALLAAIGCVAASHFLGQSAAQQN